MYVYHRRKAVLKEREPENRETGLPHTIIRDTGGLIPTYVWKYNTKNTGIPYNDSE